MEDGQPVPGSLYIYAPNKGAPIVFTVAFGASAVGHIWQCRRYKCFRLIGLHPFCAVLFTVGYALREYGAFNYLFINREASMPNLLVYVLSQVFIYICPPLLELANYHILGRLFSYVPYFAPFPAGRVLATFGVLMAFVETLNALGVALSSNPSSSQTTQELGSRLTIAALVIQLCVVVIFVFLAAVFHRRCAKANIRAKAVSTPLIILYISMLLILIRCIYRLVEHLGNATVHLDDLESLKTLSPILRYEWFFYIFEATLMLVNSVIWNIWNPGRFLPANKNVYLAQDGTTQHGANHDDSDYRPILAKAVSVATFGLLFRRKENRPMFEELGEYRGVGG